MGSGKVSSPSGWVADFTRDQQLAAAYGAIMLASSALNSVFVTFYLNVFMHVSKVTPGWFYAGQTIFAVWNAVNDPLFGWMSDTASGRSGASRRLRNIAVGGPLWAVGFALVWIPWSTSDVSPVLSGLHFAVSLCLYDGALTFVEVNHSALLSDMTHDGPTRAKANAASGIGAAIGAISSYVAQAAWASGSFGSFQAVCLAVAVLAAGVIALAVSKLNVFLDESEVDSGAETTKMELKAGFIANEASFQPEDGPMAGRRKARESTAHQRSSAQASKATNAALFGTNNINVQSPSGSAASQTDVAGMQRVLAAFSPSLRKYVQFVQQLTRHKSFMIFVVVSTIQVFDCTFEKNFFGMFLDVLTATGDGTGTAEERIQHHAVPDLAEPAASLAHSANAAVLTLSFILPHVATVLLAPLTQRIGVAAVLDRIFGARILVLCAAWAMGPVSPFMSGATVLLNRVMSECVCRSFPLVTADIVDEDTVRHGRQDSLGASVIGTAALVSKLSQSIAPMIGYSLMASISQLGAGAAAGGGVSRSDQLFVWDVLVFLPAACVVAQIIAWRSYPLRAAYMADVKAKLQRRDLQPGRRDASAAAAARSPVPDHAQSTAAPPV